MIFFQNIINTSQDKNHITVTVKREHGVVKKNTHVMSNKLVLSSDSLQLNNNNTLFYILLIVTVNIYIMS